MSSRNLLVVLLSFFVAANALATPHVVRHSAHHRAIAARVAAPEPLDIPVLPLQKRQSNRRCKQRSSSAVNAPSSSSVAPVAPATSKVIPTTSVAPPPPATTKVAPTPTPTPKKETTTPAPAPVPTTSKAVAPAPTTPKAPAPGNLPSFMVGTQTGQGTFYSTGLGACGITNKDSDHIAAVSHLLFDNFPGYNGVNPNNNPMCGRTVTATYQGKSVVVTLTDRCTGCAVTDLDFSPAAFGLLADFSVGRISGMTWVWND